MVKSPAHKASVLIALAYCKGDHSGCPLSLFPQVQELVMYT